MGEIPSPPEFDALGYLQAVYQGKIIAESQRMKAAIEALPFEKPKLSMTATIDGRKFAQEMKEIARRRGRSNVLDAKADYSNVIDASPQPVPQLDDAGQLPKVPGFRRRI
jgi:hypothetical protein